MGRDVMGSLLDRLQFNSGSQMKNRFMLAPLTNQQSYEDGKLSEDEFQWLTMCAQGGFGLTMTCASHVQEIGKGFSGQLGIWSDDHLAGLMRLAKGIRDHDSLAVVQLHHAGMRSPAELIGTKPVCPSDNEEAGARGLTLDEVHQLVEDFVAAAARAEKAGFDGVEIHGAHSYILCQFFSSEINHRDDQYGGSLENRCRILLEIIEGIRNRCREEFLVGVRLSSERFGVKLTEAVRMAERVMAHDGVDFLDMSLWDVFKEPEEKEHQGRSLMSYFTELERHGTMLGVAGKIRTPEQSEKALTSGVDFVLLGRAAMLMHDFPNRYAANRRFEAVEPPVTEAYLRNEGLSQTFVEYVKPRWPEFVEAEP